jgi:hypothetical protein
MSWIELWSNERSFRILYKGLDEREETDGSVDTEMEERHIPVWLPVIETLLVLSNFTPLRA